MAQRNRHRNSNQEILSFTGPMVLSESYDIERAKASAKRRNQRLGNTALERTKGFRRRTSGLFVPHTGTENSAIIDIPEVKIDQEQKTAKTRVYDKYEGSDVPTKKIDLWAYFASNNARKSLGYKYRYFMNESGADAAMIALHLENVSNGEIRRDAFTFDPEYSSDPDSHTERTDILACSSVVDYFVRLEAFRGDNPDLINSQGRRKWANKNHHHEYKIRMVRAYEKQLEPFAEDLFAERVEEAYWSHFSRNVFWIEVDKQHNDYKRQRWNAKSPPEPFPIEAYEGAPDNYQVSTE